MFQRIGEKIEVAGVYRQAQFIPKKMKWRNRVYVVKQVTLCTDIKEGLVRKRMYSLMVDTTLYRIVFNRDTEVWMLEELWTE